MTTADGARRTSLHLLLKRLARGTVPLLTPTVLLRKLTIAYFNNQPEVSITSDASAPEAWFALQSSDEFCDEDTRQSFYKEKRSIEDRFTNVHKRARKEPPDLFPGRRPRSFGQTLRFFHENLLSYFQTTAVLYEDITGKTLMPDEMNNLFANLPEWRLPAGKRCNTACSTASSASLGSATMRKIPAHDFPGAAVDHADQIRPANCRPGPDLGHIRLPDLIRLSCFYPAPLFLSPCAQASQANQ